MKEWVRIHRKFLEGYKNGYLNVVKYAKKMNNPTLQNLYFKNEWFMLKIVKEFTIS